MRLTNTLSGRVDPLDISRGEVGIYVCGVTPYDVAHVGHAMSLTIYDVLVRYLRWPGNPHGGLRVTFVSNYTDVDDKLIQRGHELERDPLELASANIDAWEREQQALGLLAPDVRPRVTCEIPGIIATIEAIVAAGAAYATPAGDVYFRVRAKPDYGKLSHRNIEDLRSGTRGEPGEGKEFPLDFALWKAAKPGEPAWPSPWGPGRPGWHIECTTMAQRYLGTTFDIHGGGVDLIFPHHENEIAQAEAAADGQTFARLWMHNGMVQRDGEKMSKSVGNVVTVEAALDRWTPDAIRLFVLNSQYRSPNNLTDEAMAAATRGVERLATALAQAPAGAPTGVNPEPYRARFVQAMEDDLATPQALAALFDLARAINRARDAGERVAEAQIALRELAGVLGLSLAESRAEELARLDAGAISRLASQLDVACSGKDAAQTVDALLERRQTARAERDYALADRIREALTGLGVIVEDTAEGPRWSVRRD
ncbi:MAG: cysteine--tRNA ligase [Chloroflexi bacterium]|nr:cysteine--tRNA ligase [Chloroflexota bacterium]